MILKIKNLTNRCSTAFVGRLLSRNFAARCAHFTEKLQLKPATELGVM